MGSCSVNVMLKCEYGSRMHFGGRPPRTLILYSNLTKRCSREHFEGSSPHTLNLYSNSIELCSRERFERSLRIRWFFIQIRLKDGPGCISKASPHIRCFLIQILSGGAPEIIWDGLPTNADSLFKSDWKVRTWACRRVLPAHVDSLFKFEREMLPGAFRRASVWSGIGRARLLLVLSQKGPKLNN